MAEHIRRRFSVARTGVTMAVFGLLAGLGIKNNTAQPQTFVLDPAASNAIARNVIGSSQIKNHSIQLGDIKLHQVPSYKEYKSYVATIKQQFLKLDVSNLVHKLDVYDKTTSDSTFLSKIAADAGFLHKGDTANNALKLDGLGSDQLVQGHGQVFTGNTSLGASDSDIFILIGLLRASGRYDAAAGGPSPNVVTLTNTSSSPLNVNGDGKGTTTIAPGGSAPFGFADGSVRTLQVVVQGGAQAITLNFSSFTVGNGHSLLGQALVGSF